MRIVSLAPAATEALVLMGAEDELVGVSPWCMPWLSSRKEVAGTWLKLDPRRVKGLQPDAVILQSWTMDALRGQLEGAGLNVYMLPYPYTAMGILQNAINLGRLVGRREEAYGLAAELMERLERATVDVDVGMGRRPRVYVEYFWRYGEHDAAGGLSLVDDGVWRAGGLNAFHDRIVPYFRPSDAEVAERDPDLVLVNLEPAWREMTADNYLAARPGMGELRAIREGEGAAALRLVVEGKSVNLAHMGPSFISTIEWMGELLRAARGR